MIGDKYENKAGFDSVFILAKMFPIWENNLM